MIKPFFVMKDNLCRIYLINPDTKVKVRYYESYDYLKAVNAYNQITKKLKIKFNYWFFSSTINTAI